jgi:hypothetical protein
MRYALAASAMMGLATSAGAATLDAKTVLIEDLFPNLATVAGSTTTVVGAGVEYASGSLGVSVDLAGDLITFTDLFGGGFSAEAFDGFRISDVLDGISDFTGLSFVSGSLLGINTSLTADTLLFNFSGAPGSVVGSTATYQVSFATSIPLPPPPGFSAPRSRVSAPWECGASRTREPEFCLRWPAGGRRRGGAALSLCACQMLVTGAGSSSGSTLRGASPLQRSPNP